MCHQSQESHQPCGLSLANSLGSFFRLHYMIVNPSLVSQFPRLWNILPTTLSTLTSSTWRTSSALCFSHAVQPNTVCSTISSCKSRCEQPGLGALFKGLSKVKIQVGLFNWTVWFFEHNVYISFSFFHSPLSFFSLRGFRNCEQNSKTVRDV